MRILRNGLGRFEAAAAEARAEHEVVVATDDLIAPVYVGLLAAGGREHDAREFVDWCELVAPRIDFGREEIVRHLREQLPALVDACS